MMNTTATTLLVRKDHLQTTTLQSTPLSTLADGQVRVGIDRFALTSNLQPSNLTPNTGTHDTLIKHTTMRKSIAHHMVESKQISPP